MAEREIIVVAWTNGKTGYGLKMSAADRDVHLKREWGAVDLYLPGHSRPARANIDKGDHHGQTADAGGRVEPLPDRVQTTASETTSSTSASRRCRSPSR